jgi:CRP/FNR family transcriptional regulator
MPPDSVFILKHGSMSLVAPDALGKERITRFLSPGDFFGLEAILSLEAYSFSGIAREACKVCFMDRLGFERFVRQDNSSLWKLVLMLSGLAHDSQMEKLEISGHRVRKRLQYLVARLKDPPERIPSEQVHTTSIKQWELAQFLGVSEETISREFKSLRALPCVGDHLAEPEPSGVPRRLRETQSKTGRVPI